jgi:GlpG protein
MRLIGHFDAEATARTFGDYLYVRGIDNQVESDEGRWAVWVHADEQLGSAGAFLQEFRANPGDLRFALATKEARDRRSKEQQTAEQAQKRYFDSTRLFPGVMGSNMGWLTLSLIAVCVVVFLLQISNSLGPKVESMLRISNYLNAKLVEVRHGQIWRLITPILMHGGPLHLLFNMMWMKDLGSAIERRFGIWTLAWIILLSAGISNVGQYAVSGPNFLGMSGVVYALFGYIWVRSRVDPWCGLYLDQNTVVIMLIWFGLCFTGWIGPIANTAHAGGLISGAAAGFIAGRYSNTRLGRR